MLAPASIITLAELACIEDAGTELRSSVSQATDRKRLDAILSPPIRNKFVRCHGKFVHRLAKPSECLSVHKSVLYVFIAYCAKFSCQGDQIRCCESVTTNRRSPRQRYTMCRYFMCRSCSISTRVMVFIHRAVEISQGWD